MKTNKFFGFITLIAVVILVLTLDTCDDLFWEKHEHEWGPWWIVNTLDHPTCSTAGLETRNCNGYDKGQPCPAWETRAIPPDPSLHFFLDPRDEDIIVEPTCTEGGMGTSYCSRCGESKVVDMGIRHDFSGGGIRTREPTCTSSGTIESDCMKCGLHTTGTISPLGHSWVNSGSQWLTQYRCSRCGIYSAGKY